MMDLLFTTPTMLRQRALPGLVCRVALMAGYRGRIAPASVGGGGRAP